LVIKIDRGRDDGNVSDRISIVIAEDSLLVRDSLSRALSTNPDVAVVGVAEDYDSAVELVEKHGPTILVTDVRMPPTSTDEGSGWRSGCGRRIRTAG
jgi:DNA-binding NarL/FixJ family response regulator